MKNLENYENMRRRPEVIDQPAGSIVMQKIRTIAMAMSLALSGACLQPVNKGKVGKDAGDISVGYSDSEVNDSDDVAIDVGPDTYADAESTDEECFKCYSCDQEATTSTGENDYTSCTACVSCEDYGERKATHECKVCEDCENIPPDSKGYADCSDCDGCIEK